MHPEFCCSMCINVRDINYMFLVSKCTFSCSAPSTVMHDGGLRFGRGEAPAACGPAARSAQRGCCKCRQGPAPSRLRLRSCCARQAAAAAAAAPAEVRPQWVACEEKGRMANVIHPASPRRTKNAKRTTSTPVCWHYGEHGGGEVCEQRQCDQRLPGLQHGRPARFGREGWQIMRGWLGSCPQACAARRLTAND